MRWQLRGRVAPVRILFSPWWGSHIIRTLVVPYSHPLVGHSSLVGGFGKLQKQKAARAESAWGRRQSEFLQWGIKNLLVFTTLVGTHR